MKISSSNIQSLLHVFLPEDLFDYFKITNVEITKTSVDVFLEELNIRPSGYEEEKLMSKGFYPSISVQDFPIRERPVFLHIKRRRWEVKSTKEIVSRDWNSIAQGTRLTTSFASFLKELSRYTSSK